MSKHKQDQSYRELFSHPRMIQDLLKGFVSEDFIKNIDFSSIETRRDVFIAAKFKRRETDLIVKLKVKEQEVYIYCLVEFQSKPDKFIGLRLLTYILLFYQFLIKEKKIKGRGAKLPPVFPMVVYTGKNTWNMITELKDLIHQPYEDLKKYVPQFTYYPIALNQLQKENLKGLYSLKNIVAAFFNLVISENEKDILKSEKVLSKLVDYKDELGESILNWLNHFFMSKDIDIHKITMKGGKNMLDTVIDNIKKEGMEKGKQKEKIEVALNLIKMNLSVEQIAQATGLPLDVIQKMMNSN